MNRFRVNERTIRNAFPTNITLDLLAERYLKETFENLMDKVDASRINNRSDMNNFVQQSFPESGQLRLYIGRFLDANNPMNVEDFKATLFNAITSWFLSYTLGSRGRRDIDLKALLELITKDNVLFYGISQYMPPTAFYPYNSYPPNENTFSIQTMKNAIDNFNKNNPRLAIQYYPQGLEILNEILKTVVYAVREYQKIDPDFPNRIVNALPVAQADDGSSVEHKLTSKIFTLVVQALSAQNKTLTEQGLRNVLPTLPGYPYISLFLIYPMKL